MKSTTHPTIDALTRALLTQDGPPALADMARACDQHGQEWRGWVIEHLALMDGQWREDALDVLEPIIIQGAITQAQAGHLVDLALDKYSGPDLRVLGMLKGMGYPLGGWGAQALECASRLANGVWLPPEVLADGLFSSPDGSNLLSEFFVSLIRPGSPGRDVDLVHLQRIERAGLLGPPTHIQPKASVVVAHRCRDFLQWDDFIETGNFEQALVWMIEKDWVRVEMVRAAIERDLPRNPRSEAEGPLLEMMIREHARVFQDKMQSDTPQAKDAGPGVHNPRF